MASEWENRGGIISEMHSAWTPSSAQFGHADWSGPWCYVVAEKAIEATRGEPETERRFFPFGEVFVFENLTVRGSVGKMHDNDRLESERLTRHDWSLKSVRHYANWVTTGFSSLLEENNMSEFGSTVIQPNEPGSPHASGLEWTRRVHTL